MMLTPIDLATTRIMLRKELLADGWNDRAIAAMVRSREWVRVRHGAYVAAAVWSGLDAAGRHELTVRAVLKQSKTELVPSHSSAMPFYDGPTWGLQLDFVHGTRTDGKCGRREAGVQQHCGKIAEDDVVVRRGVRVMSPCRTGLEVTTVAPTEAALVAVNHLLHAGHTSVEDLKQRYERGFLFWKGTLATDLVLRLADAAIESVGESRFFYFCYAAGLPAPIPQYVIRDERGQVVARVDFAWPELGVFVEFDGKVKYEALLKPGESASDVVIREKRREELIVELTGWRCIRVVWSDLENPEALMKRIRQALAGHRVEIG
jgi:very-short-patch-repair endonuclease